jgi:hypothetical protein
MPGDRWDSWPSRVSQERFLEMMNTHSHVEGQVEQLSPSRFDLTLSDGIETKVFITDVYEFTVSDYENLRTRYPQVNCIVTASTWNHFTTMARQQARDDGVATFHFRGLMGALNRRGDDFLDYPDAP